MMCGFARVRRALRLAPLVIAVAALGACSATETGSPAANLDLTAASASASATETVSHAAELDLTTTSASATAAPAMVAAAPAPEPAKPLDEVKDDLTLGKEHFRATNYGLAELHYRRAVEATGAAEAWLGLAATYDQLKRFELADRAYREVLKRTGPTPELLNNRGYSYLLRGNFRRASQDLSAAAAQAPNNERIQNNLKALDSRARRRV
jgi:Flp pilus assembly protein TadD